MTNQHNCATDIPTPEFFIARHRDLATVDARIDAFCRWFDCEPPKIERDEDGEVLLTDELFAWFKNEAASLDWILLGDPKYMAAVYRGNYLAQNTLVETVQQLDKTEQEFMLTALEANAEGLVSFEYALQVFKESVEEYRATKKAGVA